MLRIIPIQPKRRRLGKRGRRYRVVDGTNMRIILERFKMGTRVWLWRVVAKEEMSLEWYRLGMGPTPWHALRNAGMLPKSMK